MKKLGFAWKCCVLSLFFLLSISGCGGGGGAGVDQVAVEGPVAVAGNNQTVAIGEVVILNGDDSLNAKTFKWTILSKPEGSVASLIGSNQVKPVFVADVVGAYVIGLVVNDGKKDSALDTTIITTVAANGDTPAVANAGPDQTVQVGAVVRLNGAASTGALTYRWKLASRPGGSNASLSSDAIVSPTFVADLVGIYVLSLEVNNGLVDSNPDTVIITVGPFTGGSIAPVSNAGTDQIVQTGTTVQLTGAASTGALQHQWAIVSKPAGSNSSLSSASVVNPTFVADLPGNYVFSLIVNNNTSQSMADNVTITVTGPAANSAPVANAGPDQLVVRGATVQLNGAASTDPNSNILTYRWALDFKPAGSSAVISNATTAGPSFVADTAGVYQASLIVNDGALDSVVDTVSVSAF